MLRGRQRSVIAAFVELGVGHAVSPMLRTLAQSSDRLSVPELFPSCNNLYGKLIEVKSLQINFKSDKQRRSRRAQRRAAAAYGVIE